MVVESPVAGRRMPADVRSILLLVGYAGLLAIGVLNLYEQDWSGLVLVAAALAGAVVVRGRVRNIGIWLVVAVFGLGALAGLDTVLVGGEKLSRQHAERFLRRWPAIRLVNGYGPVESSVFVLTHEVGLDRPAGDVPLGVPVPRTQVRVVTGDRPAPPRRARHPATARARLTVAGYPRPTTCGLDPPRIRT